jgi:hypothetical protein
MLVSPMTTLSPQTALGDLTVPELFLPYVRV